MKLKLYDINRLIAFNISAKFDVQFSYLGTLFAEAWLTDENARDILEAFPNSIRLLNRS